MKFPKQIYVTPEGPQNEYLYAMADGSKPTDIDKAVPCAIYELVEVGKLEVSRTFVTRSKPRKDRT